MTRRQDDDYILPVTLDRRLGEGGLKTAICYAVGEFYERATCVILPGERLRQDNGLVCPDGKGNGEFYEVKASGQGQWIIDSAQLDGYDKMEEEGATLTYVLWAYKGRPALKLCCKTRRQIFETLAARTTGCWVLSLADLYRSLKKCPSQNMGVRQSDLEAVVYYRPSKRMLPVRPLVRIPELVLTIETVPFVLKGLDVVVVGKERWYDSVEDGPAPF